MNKISCFSTMLTLCFINIDATLVYVGNNHENTSSISTGVILTAAISSLIIIACLACTVVCVIAIILQRKKCKCIY